ncbi:hypothetical protein F5Y03DRAFT_380621 [Xylaria venustula]|nr:hypothetical protein F5Y03DRAFT_380621 [Xylaria venustula]
MEEGSGTPLRASCNRCRAQKLRCVPSAETDACERCVRAKLENECVFSKRLRSGRNKRPSESNNNCDLFRKAQEPLTSELPGLGVFPLSTSPTSTDLAENSMKFPLDFSSFEFLCPDQLLQMTPEFLFDMPETSTTVSSDPGSDMGHSHTGTGVGTSLFDVPIDITRMLPLSTPSEKAAIPTADTDPSPRNEDPGDDGEMLDPITTLTGLLSEIRRYEGQLAQISGQPNGTFENYPIGEALFLSKRFCSFLSNCSDRPLLSQSGFSTPTSAPSEQYLPIILLALSCYLSLVHVHQSVFTHMHSHLLRITDSGPRPDSSAAVSTQTMGSTSISTPSDVEADMHAYRGLQLCQLQPVSTEWELALM